MYKSAATYKAPSNWIPHSTSAALYISGIALSTLCKWKIHRRSRGLGDSLAIRCLGLQRTLPHLRQIQTVRLASRDHMNTRIWTTRGLRGLIAVARVWTEPTRALLPLENVPSQARAPGKLRGKKGPSIELLWLCLHTFPTAPPPPVVH